MMKQPECMVVYCKNSVQVYHLPHVLSIGPPEYNKVNLTVHPTAPRSRPHCPGLNCSPKGYTNIHENQNKTSPDCRDLYPHYHRHHQQTYRLPVPYLSLTAVRRRRNGYLSVAQSGTVSLLFSHGCRLSDRHFQTCGGTDCYTKKAVSATAYGRFKHFSALVPALQCRSLLFCRLHFRKSAARAPHCFHAAHSILFRTLCPVHSCINGYFYGIKKAGIPAGAQLLEQAARVGCVYIVSAWFLAQGRALSINVAVLGLTVGELFSMLLTIAAISPYGFPLWKKESGQILYGKLLAMALPLTANRIVLNFLQSIESVSIPTQLKNYGYDTITALSVYGVFTGMAMPFIYFPNALTSSVAVLLLPIISENYALGNMDAVKKATLRTIKYCGLMGICCMGVFVLLGRWAGTTLFNSPLAGYFITTLGFICPFLYLDTTLSSILQGLGLAGHIFIINVICLLMRLGFVFLAVPRFGITGYLWGLLVSQLALGILYLGCLNRFLRKANRSSRHFRN